MKKNKKLLTLVLSVAMLLPMISLPMTASVAQTDEVKADFALSEIDSSMSSLPGEVFFEDHKLGLHASGSSISVDQTAVKTARKYLREHQTKKLFGLILPTTTFSVKVKTNRADDEEYRNEYSKALLDEAMEHTGNPIEGDYMSRQMNGYTINYDTSESGYLTITYKISFFTSREQEDEMDTKVEEIIDSLNLDGKTEYQKVKAIYDYLCENVVYDNVSLYIAMTTAGYLHNPVGHSAYGGLCKGTCVCQGYATAFYRLALTAGIDARVIFGEAPGGGHAWNIVRVDGKYYLIDSTWDAGQAEYSYFLKCEKDFPDHEPDDEHKTADWLSKYPIAAESYDPSKQQPVVEPTKPSSKIIGDVDGDSIITSADSLSVLRMSVKLETVADLRIADVNGNGTPDSQDALEILRYSVELPSEYNIGKKVS